MRTIILVVAAFAVGLAAGWSVHRNRDVQEIRRFRSLVGLSDQQIQEAYQTSRETMQKMEFDDSMAAVTCLVALRKLHRSDDAGAREILALRAASYYVVYGPPGNPNKKMNDSRLELLKKIDAAKDEIPELRKAIVKALVNVNAKE